MDLMRYTHIIWDWNGTLLDDAWLCVEVMNGMLHQRDLPPLTLPKYRTIFNFPVRAYYENIGFDFHREPFEQVGLEFVILYNQRQNECQLHPGVTEILSCISGSGIRQLILSARQQEELIAETRKLKVNHFFDRIAGLEDHYAYGKTGAGIRLLKDMALPTGAFLFIGDTLHDAEVARELKIDCLLISHGHHTQSRLESTGFPVYRSLSDLIPLLCPSD